MLGEAMTTVSPAAEKLTGEERVAERRGAIHYAGISAHATLINPEVCVVVAIP